LSYAPSTSNSSISSDFTAPSPEGLRDGAERRAIAFTRAVRRRSVVMTSVGI